MRTTRTFEQSEILHVARADLNHIGVTLDQIHRRLVEGFSYDLQSKLIPNVDEHFKSLLAQSGKRVRRCAWFERAATEKLDAAFINSLCRRKNLLAGFNRTRPGDDRERS